MIEIKEYLGKFNPNIIENEHGYFFESFSGIEEEIRLLNEGTGCYVMSSFSFLEINGKDSIDFLHRITTNDLKYLIKNSLCPTIFTNEKGRILDVSTLFNFGDFNLLLCNKDKKQIIQSWIDRYVIMDDVKCKNVDDRFTSFALMGPQSDTFTFLICGKEVEEVQENTFKVFSVEGINFFCAKINSPIYPFKYIFIVNRDNGENLLKLMNENKGVFDFGFIGEEAYNLYRIQNQIPGSNELNSNYNPHEAKILSLVNFKKGCYIGQEVIARLDTYDKVQKYLTLFSFEEDTKTENNFIIFDENKKEIGNITSIAFSHKQNKYLALGYLRKQFIIKDSEYKAFNSNGNYILVKVIN